MRHLDLFSGIGGFALAVDAVWPGSEHIFCEIDPYCQALLKKRFGGSKLYGDIRELGFTPNTSGLGCTGDKEINTDKGREQTFNDTSERNIDILTGGFPCQPFSQAGKRRGTSDNRYLWPEMLRVIREFKPTWVIAENVRGLLNIEGGVVFEQVCLDLEDSGYEVQPFIIPAVSKNAPHRRDRVWFVAHASSWNAQQGDVSPQRCSERSTEKRETKMPSLDRGCCDGGGVTEAGRVLIQDAPYTQRDSEQGRVLRQGQGEFRGSDWEQNWLEVATELCGVDDGLSAELDGLKLSKSKHRVERLKALGNSIVPQVAIEIMRAIKEANDDKENNH